MVVKEIKINDLKEYENNPRINDGAVEAVANSIKEFGFKVPIVIDKNNVIIAGHTRLKASKLLGLEKVPCIVADDLTEEQIKGFRLVDNKTSELAEWDIDKLEIELAELQDVDFDLEHFGFELNEFNNDIELDDIVEDDTPEVDEKNTPKTQKGQVYKLGNHYLMCGDSTNKNDVSTLLSGGGKLLICKKQICL